ncbi:MAG TPA: hypothetical protein VGQ54_12420 [Burkholderiales bacterium]|nr:hypothetical protein [Burkholderiales bacterium]
MSEKSVNDMERDARLEALYHAATRDEPPQALDDAIRAAARRAVSSKPRSAVSPFSRSWGVPVSIAAVIVLSVSLVVVIRDEAPEMVKPPRADAPAMSAERRQEPVASDRASSVPEASPPPKPKQSNGIRLNAPQQALRPDAGIRDNAAPPSATQPQKDARAMGQLRPAPSLLAKRSPAEAFPAPGAARDKASASDEQPSLKEEMRRDDDAVGEPKTRSERNQSQAKATPSVSAETKTQRQRELEADSADSTSRARVAAAPESKPAAAAAAAPSVSGTPAKPASPAADAMQGYVDLPPEKWLERIADLRKQGRIEEAKASFTAFRKRYPEHPLPASLKDWANP